MRLLSETQIKRLCRVPEGENRLRNDGRFLALHFAATQDGSEQRKLLWNHLLLAAGNLERWNPLHPASPFKGSPAGVIPATVNVPVGNGAMLHLMRDDAATWAEFERQTRGVGVGTTTVLLSLLWPLAHVRAGQRAVGAAIGIVGHRSEWSEAPVDPDSHTLPLVTWETYDWYRRQVLETAATRSPLQVERSLHNCCPFGFDPLRRVPAAEAWRSYGLRLDTFLRTSNEFDLPFEID